MKSEAEAIYTIKVIDIQEKCVILATDSTAMARAGPTGGDVTFDRIDLKILDLLQRDATIPVARIADEVGLSQTPCWKRIQKHEEAGVIKSRVALLDPEAFGLSLTAFVMIEADEQTAEWRASFIAAVEKLEPTRDVYRLAGNYDFLLRVVVRDMAALDRFCENLTSGIRLRRVNSVFALEAVRTTTSVPIAALISGS